MSRTFHTILVPIDFSAYSAEALQYAGAVAQSYGASLMLLHVISKEIVTVTTYERHTGRRVLPPHAYALHTDPVTSTGAEDTVIADLHEQGMEALQHFLPDEFRGLSVERRVAVGRPFEQILETAAQEQVDLIVMGTHGRTGLTHVALGSVAERVVRMASCPVLTVKAPASPKPPSQEAFEQS